MNTLKTLASSPSSGLANYFCKLRINDVEVSSDAINAIVLRNWIFDLIPRIDLTITDNGNFAELWDINDSSEIQIEIGKTKESNHINATFIVDNHSIDILHGNSSNIITITGYLKYSDFLFPVHTRAFKNETSVSVLEQLAREAGWKTDKRVDTSDTMPSWLQINSCNFDMMKHCLERAFIPSDLLMAWANFENKFVITSLKTCVDSPSKIMRFDLKKAALDTFENKIDETVLWTNGYKFNDISGYTNKVIGGYGLTSTYYDLKSKIDLSSAIDYHPLAPNKSNQSHLGKHIDSINYGTLTANTYGNYFKGQIQNRNLLGVSFNNMITAKINPIALGNINLGDVVDFVMPSINATQSNEIYSGRYLTCGMVMYASKGAPLQVELNLLRNGKNESTIA